MVRLTANNKSGIFLTFTLLRYMIKPRGLIIPPCALIITATIGIWIQNNPKFIISRYEFALL